MICNQLKENLNFHPPLSIKRVFLQVSRPAFSLGSLPGKQEKHLNQWKVCLTVLGSTAPFLQRHKTLQPHQLETTDSTLMEWGVKSGSNEKKAGLIMAGGGFYGAFNVRSLIHGCWWKKLNWQNGLVRGLLHAGGLNRSSKAFGYLCNGTDLFGSPVVFKNFYLFFLSPREAELNKALANVSVH